MREDAVLKARTVRLSRRMDKAVHDAARQEGITVSQFIREAVLARLTMLRTIDHPEEAQDLERCLRDMRDGTI